MKDLLAGIQTVVNPQLDQDPSPQITIGMPVYNGERFVIEAIESVLNQTSRDLVLIISDNSSTDSTSAICREYERTDPRVRYIRQEQNLGGYRNFEFVLNAAQTPFFCWLACDDAMEVDYLKTALDVLNRDESVVLVATDMNVVDSDGRVIDERCMTKIRPTIRWTTRSAQLFQLSSGFANYAIYGVMRTAPAVTAFRNAPELSMLNGHEMSFLSRMACEGEVLSLPEKLFRYRKHDASSFAQEVEASRKSSPVAAEIRRSKHLLQLIFDQLQVLTRSAKPWPAKVEISTRVGFAYLGKLPRLAQVWARAFRTRQAESPNRP